MISYAGMARFVFSTKAGCCSKGRHQKHQSQETMPFKTSEAPTLWSTAAVCYGKSPFFMGKINYKWPFSIAMLFYQRVLTLFFAAKKDCWMLLETFALSAAIWPSREDPVQDRCLRRFRPKGPKDEVTQPSRLATDWRQIQIKMVYICTWMGL